MSLKRWLEEKWKTSDGRECGSSKSRGRGSRPLKCRPSKRVSKETPKTWSELSKTEKKAAVRDKAEANKKGRQFGKKRFKVFSKIKPN